MTYVVVTNHTVPLDLAERLRAFVDRVSHVCDMDSLQCLMAILNYASAIEVAPEKESEDVRID